MFVDAPKLLLILAMGVAPSMVLTRCALCAETGTNVSPAAKIKALANTQVEKGKQLAIAQLALTDAETADRRLTQELAAASADLAAKETKLDSLLDSAEKATTSADLKPVQESAGAAALAVRRARVVKTELQSRSEAAKKNLAAQNERVKSVAKEIDDVTAEIEKATEELVQSKPATEPDSQTAAHVEEPSSPAEKPAAPDKKPAAPEEPAVQPAKEPVEPAKKPVEPAPDIPDAAPAADKKNAAKAAEAEAASKEAATASKQAADNAEASLKRATSAATQAREAATQAAKDAEAAAETLKKSALASKPIDAFNRLPLVTSIENARSNSDFCQAASGDRSFCNSFKEVICDYRFDAAAHFPFPVFGLGGEQSEGEGAVIYEGMRFAINKDGRYQVRFVVGTPAMPVTMRLQLILEDERTRNRYTLTLPPVSIPEPDKPEQTSQRREVNPVYGNFQTVHHEGYLPALDGRAEHIRVVRRTGSARFGFGVDVP